MNILITSAGRRVSLVTAFKHELTKYFTEGKVFTADLKPELSSACRISDKFFPVPRVDDLTYCLALLEICISNNIKLIIPTIDTELLPIAKNIDLFKKNGIDPIVSSVEVIQICRDKRKTHNFFDSIGFPRVNEIDISNPVFPFFVKPYDGSSSIGIKVIEDSSQITDAMIGNEKLMFLEYINPLKYIEYTIDLYYDKNFFLKCAVPRERIEVRTGEVSKGVTRRNEVYEQVCRKFSYSYGFVGCITLQLFKKMYSSEIFGIEINPRFGGGYPLSYHANANFPEMIIREYLLGENVSFFDNWKENLLMLRYDDEILVYDYKG